MARELNIATAPSRLAKKWRNITITWEEMLARCAATVRTNETVAEYRRMSKDEQSNVKDVGGFVGGYLKEGLRKNGQVRHRDLLTLDIDYGEPGVWQRFCEAFDCAALIYSTHKHTPEAPRLRLVIPTARSLRPEEYEPVCRRVAAMLGIDLFDISTYQLPRLFYWPSTPRDGEFVFESQGGEFLNPDTLLATYTNPLDASEWPMGSRESEIVTKEMRKAGDPTEKPGVIGAFCRAYTIEDAIDTFLPDIYEATAQSSRYTYRQGSVAGGLICYGGKFAYSHHETDPAGRRLCNAFDLVRIHKFGYLDEGSRVTEITRMPSYQGMQTFASEDKQVRRLLNKEHLEEVSRDFAGVDLSEIDDEWMTQLKRNAKTTAIESTASNILTVLHNDPNFKGKLWHNEFNGFDYIEGGLPWDKEAKTWKNRDDANLRIYMETVYGITGKDKIKDAKEAVFTEFCRHPVKEYLASLEWDGKPRLARLIIDYLGAEDNELTRAMTIKHFVAAVKRIFEPGCKHDYCLILQGPEGIGKSTLLAVMAGEWFNDSLVTTEGKEGMEALRNSWIVELGELSSIKRSDVEQVKNYLSRQEDNYRPAYGSVVEKHPRQCVFFGTTNETHFLKGDSGNRRFWVVAVNPDLRKVSDTMKAVKADRDQLWAEAVHLYSKGEVLYLSPEMEEEARKRQAEFNDDSDDPMCDLLAAFLESKLPLTWHTRGLMERRGWWRDPNPIDDRGTEPRERFCIAEFVCERLGRDMSDKDYKYTARKVGKLMESMPGWKKGTTSKHVKALYGIQKCYYRVNQEEDDL